LEFEICLSTGAECYIYGLDISHQEHSQKVKVIKALQSKN